jgi:hypothetical protein
VQIPGRTGGVHGRGTNRIGCVLAWKYLLLLRGVQRPVEEMAGEADRNSFTSVFVRLSSAETNRFCRHLHSLLKF